MNSIHTSRFAAAALLWALFGGGHVLADETAKPTPPLHILRPVANAVVRETVPVRVAPADIPSDSYVGITIDGVFRTARVISPAARKSGIVFEWDTKSAYTTSDDPDTSKYYADGDHTLKIDMYDRSGNVEGEATVPVRVVNKISIPAQGIKLAYHWTPNLQLHYLHRSELDTVPSSPGLNQAPQNVEASLIHFSRSVEDASGGNFLVRDTVLPNSFLVSRGQTQRLDATYPVKSQYRTVNSRGDILRVSAPLSPGLHVGFSIPVLSARRVAVGDSWQAPVQISLDWAGNQTGRVTAESRLEGFEWQNGYPSAKIRETYTGPVTFKTRAATGTTVGMAAGGMTAGAMTSFEAQTVKYERVIFFAYNSGRLVHTEANIDITTDLPSTALSALGLSGGAGAGGYGGYGANPMGGAYGSLLNGDSGGGPPDEAGGIPGGDPGAMMPDAGGYPGGPPDGGGYPGAMYGGGMKSGYPGGFQGGRPGGYPGGGPGGYPGSPGPGQYGTGVQQSTATKLKITDITSLLT